MKRFIAMLLIALLLTSACSTGNWANLPYATESLSESRGDSSLSLPETSALASSTEESSESTKSETDKTTTKRVQTSTTESSGQPEDSLGSSSSVEETTSMPDAGSVDPTSVEADPTTAATTAGPTPTMAATTAPASTVPTSLTSATAATTTAAPPTIAPTTVAATVPPTTAAPTVAPTQAPSTFTPYVKNNILIMSDRATDLFGSTAALQTDYASLINRVASTIPTARVFNLLAPTAVEFYAPANYNSGSASQKASITAIYNQLSNVTSVDAYSPLQAHKNEYLYLRTDHHWTGLGAYYAYTAFAQRAGIGALPLSSFTAGRIPNSFLGTFYGWSGKVASLVPLADSIDYWYPPYSVRGWSFPDASMGGGREILLIRTNHSGANHYLAFTDGDHKLARFDSSIGNGKSILVIKESYGNAMIPYLTAHYQNVYVLDPRLIQPNLKNLVEANGIQTILIINYNAIIGNPTWKNGLRASLGG